jgi:hypothetical protein
MIKIPVKSNRNFCKDIDFSECDKEEFDKFVYSTLYGQVDIDSINETVERKMQLMEM